VKVTIVPRGEAALGYAQYLPKEKYLTLKEELEDQMCMTLGGRAVEEIVFGKISTGALSDLQQITRMAYSMVSVYGMTDKIGNVSFYDPQNETGKMIDEEVRQLIDTAYERVKKLLRERINEVTTIAEQLLKKEVLYKDDMVELLGERPFEQPLSVPTLITEETENSTIEPDPPQSPASDSPNSTNEV
jgi:cell division protease FtsH